MMRRNSTSRRVHARRRACSASALRARASGRSWQPQFVRAERREMPLDLGVARPRQASRAASAAHCPCRRSPRARPRRSRAHARCATRCGIRHCMHSSNDQSRPRRTCASASLRLVGDLVADRRGGRGSPRHRRPRASSARQNILDAVAREQPVDRGAVRRHRPLARRLGEGRERRIDRDVAAQRIGQIGETRPSARDASRSPAATASAASAARRSARQ